MLSACAAGATWEHGARCIGEAKVSFERNGPQGTSAEARPDLSGTTLAVALTLRGTCWTAGSLYLSGGEGWGPRRLLSKPKTLGFQGRTSDAGHMQKRASSARRRQGSRKATLTILSLVLSACAAGATWEHGARCIGEATVSFERTGPLGRVDA